MRASTSNLRKAAVAFIIGGTLQALSVAAELVHSGERDGRVVELGLSLVYVLSYGVGAAMLAVGLLFLRAAQRQVPGRLSRPGRVGLWMATAGSALLAIFAGQAAVAQVSTGASPEFWALYLLGMLILIIGCPMYGLALRRSPLLGSAWMLLVVAGASVAIAAMAEADPYHDIGLFIYFAAWIVIGWSALSRTEQRELATAVQPN
jgi:hypothetical protein